MASTYIDTRNLKFTLFELLKVQELCQYEFFADHEHETLEMMIDSAKQIADEHFFPFLEEADRKGVTYENGTVTVHPQVKKVMEVMGENGWIGPTFSYEDGGMQLPHTLGLAAEFIFNAANNNFAGYPGLTAGAAKLIASFGSDELKAAFIEKMTTGKWQGTMALTEPQAGSSLSDITTSATPMADGTYRISGTKIFISSGDYTDIENVVHLMLARIDDAPPGTKGISLFVVPKHRMTEGGNLEYNDVTTAGVFHKMGQNGYATVHLVMGEKDDCHGYLVGEANRGLSYMFQMMNGARLAVGMTGTAIASAAYHASLQYAQERPQGRRWGDRDLSKGQTLIINHPDVRRMLMSQRAMVEGTLSLILEGGRYLDLEHVSEGEERKKYNLLAEILTPITKAYPTDAGLQSVSNGMQVLGGYGYCEDFPLEQYYRDIRITPLYEGTNGIQSLDLLGRKVTMENGAAFKLLMGEIGQTVAAASSHDDLRKYAGKLKAEIDRLIDVTQHLSGIAMKGQVELFLADATIYMELFGLVTVAWQWLKQATLAAEKLAAGNLLAEDTAFYEGKIHTMKFFFVYELTKCIGLVETLKAEESLTVLTDKDVLQEQV